MGGVTMTGDRARTLLQLGVNAIMLVMRVSVIACMVGQCHCSVGLVIACSVGQCDYSMGHRHCL